MILAAEKFILRPWQTGDEPSLVKYANNFKIWLNLRDVFPYPYTLRDAENWIKIANNPERINLAIEISGEAAGAIGIAFQKDVYYRSAEIGFWLGEDFWQKGIITEAVKLLTSYVFQHYDICRIYAQVFAYNKGSMKVLEKAGFMLEGILKQAVTKNGQTVDAYLFALVQ